jgi:N-hydroxyarylamine O-acetyltransferase
MFGAVTDADEWTIDALDLDAYLRRVGYDGDTAPTGATLAAVHRAHVDAIAFENLDIVLGRGIEVDLPSVQAKLVDRGRGGYCFEHGLLFAAALERLGFTVERLLARVGGDGDRPRARTHVTLRVSAGTERWLADVGFGSGLLEPLPFDEAGPQEQGAWAFELVTTGAGTWALREREDGQWVTGYVFDDQRQHAADVVMSNYFISTHPRSPFVGQAVVVRKDEQAIRRLRGRVFTVTHPDWSTEERTLDDAELAGTLRDVFRLPLSDDEVAQVAAATG